LGKSTPSLWIYQRLSSPYVHDTEAWVSIKTDEGIALDNLVKISKQSTTANRRALEDGSLQNVPASMRQEESLTLNAVSGRC